MLNIGLLGAAAVSPVAIICPARRRSDVAVVAIASRTNASAYAETYDIERSYESYDSLLDDAQVDLVYNALPPSGHAEWTIAALRAGKDVLCEKPFTMTAAEARRVRDVARETGRRAIEAFHDHYHPLNTWIRDTVAKEPFGRIHHAEAVFRAPFPFVAGSLRHDPALGGGALMDLGCYTVHWLRALFGNSGEVRSATARRNPQGADQSMTAELEFVHGPSATLHCEMDPAVSGHTSLLCEGERGRLEVSNLVFPALGHTIRLEIDGTARVGTIGGWETYDYQLAALVDALRTGEQLPTEGDDSVANMELIDAIYSAAGFDRPWL